LTYVDRTYQFFKQTSITDNTSQPDEIARPSFQSTFLFRGPKFLYNKSIGRVLGQTADHAAWEANGEPLDVVPEAHLNDEPALSSAIPANAASESRKRKLKK
jgi:hypothetical protein